MNQPNARRRSEAALDELFRQVLAWAKDAMVLGHADYHFQHESILYGYKPLGGGGRLGRGGTGWYGDNRQVSLLEVPRPRAAREHRP